LNTHLAESLCSACTHASAEYYFAVGQQVGNSGMAVTGVLVRGPVFMMAGAEALCVRRAVVGPEFTALYRCFLNIKDYEAGAAAKML
jgi:hypothetical protein